MKRISYEWLKSLVIQRDGRVDNYNSKFIPTNTEKTLDDVVQLLDYERTCFNNFIEDVKELGLEYCISEEVDKLIAKIDNEALSSIGGSPSGNSTQTTHNNGHYYD